MAAPTVLFIWPHFENDEHLLFQRFTEQQGWLFRYLPAPDVEQVLSQGSVPDVIVVKRRLYANDDGLAFCRAARRDPRLARVPLIVGWADIGPGGNPPAFDAGANGVVGRVMDIDDVAEMIALLLREPHRTHITDDAISQQRRARQR